MDIQIGDDITVAGKVIKADWRTVEIETAHYHRYMIHVEDIKTHRPNGEGEAE